MGTIAMGMAACSGDAPTPGVPTGLLHIGIAVAPSDLTTEDDDEAVRLQALTVGIDQLIIDDVAPSGDESVAVFVDEVLEPLVAVEVIAVELQVGHHADFSFELRTGGFGPPGLFARAAGGDDDGTVITLEVDRLALAFVTPVVEISDTPREGSIVFDPAAWFAGVKSDDDDSVTIDVTSGAAYEALLDRIAASTRFVLDGEDLDPTPPAGTDDDDGDDDDDDGDDG